MQLRRNLFRREILLRVSKRTNSRMPVSMNQRSVEDLTLSGEIELFGDDSSSAHGPVERRAKPRLRVAFPSLALGIDVAGKAFEVDCVLDNLSSSGVYFRLPGSLVPGA